MRILATDAVLHIIDVQERLTPHIHNYQTVVACIARLMLGCQTLGLPVVVNEQYKKGLGETVSELQTLQIDSVNRNCFEKVTFSACDDEPTMHHIKSLGKNNIIICGIETHVCVMQTALDLLGNGYQPVVICDAVGSRFPIDHSIAIDRIRQAGGIISSSESILFELCRSSKSPEFKTISGLVK